MSDELPGILGEIQRVAGTAAALKICNEAGGTRVYIPAQASDRHWLVKAVGREAADKITRHFTVDQRRGLRIEIPVFAGTYKQMLRRISERLGKAGPESSAELARTLGITQRTVHRHRARKRDKRNHRQGNLF